MKNSLQIRLSLGLSLTILGVALAGGIVTYFWAYKEAYEMQDGMLRQVAALCDNHHLTISREGIGGEKTKNDDESPIFVEQISPVSSTDSNKVSQASLLLPVNLVEGIQTVSAGSATYRVLVRTLNSGMRVAVAQEISFHDEAAREMALHALLPFLILVPVLLLVMTGIIRRIFRSITNLAAEIDRRETEQLGSIPSEDLPSEVQSFANAINQLLKRIEQSMQAQRRFISDAAHELRSPMTALSLQADRLAEVEMSPVATERLFSLRQGISRSRTLLDQLLTLARVHISSVAPEAKISLRQIYRRALEDLVPLAQAKNIDIGIINDVDASVFAHEVDLIVLVKNLIDNAIRYTPVGGRVDLSLVSEANQILLIIEDNGPGIPEAERERVFDPFYRVLGNETLGSGLGLSIVQTIVARIGAKVTLEYANNQAKSGLRVSVIFPVMAEKNQTGRTGEF